ncbi:NADH-quinone oxidoreductase subunit NuoH [Aquihabitans sp. McL0605]|uniref:NADH-quinone oxidoreductase subunit NuoH n=1 Tax=Aquihabitans sp. McL0605 TaxID=3415671 RepID=UPI003CF04E25
MLLANDPLLAGHIDFGVVLIVIIKAAITLGITLIATMLMIWFERKVISDLQNRVGPNRAGPFGILQTLADGLKVLLKEDLIPDKSDKWIFRLAPILTMVPAFIVFGLIPLGGDFRNGNDGVVHMFGHDTYLQLADPGAGVLVILAMSSIAVYGVMLAGWSSGSKYPLLGSVRASAQMVSYEAALGLSVLAVVLVSGTLTTNGIVASQSMFGWNLWTTWLLPFVIFCLAATAELNRPPFDLVEAEQELVGSFQTEYSGFRFAIFYLAEFLNAITMAAIIVTLFLGGPNGPVLIGPGWAWGFVWFLIKIVVILYIFVWVRASVPRVRYDQLMDLGWKLLIPLGLGWLLVLVALQLAQNEGWTVFQQILTVLAGVVAMALCASVLSMAMRAAKRNRVLEGVID